MYRIKKGNTKERYLKDDRALEDYLTEVGIEGVTLSLHGGAPVMGEPLRHLVDKTRAMKTAIKTLARKVGHQAIVEQAAIAGALSVGLTTSADMAGEAAAYVAKRLDALLPAKERGWKGESNGKGGMLFSRTKHGVVSRFSLDSDTLRSAEARKLDGMTGDLQEWFQAPAKMTIKDKTVLLTGPVALVDAIMEHGKQGLTMQRYKGLGEMNPEQLWETTLDPSVRTLLQVKVQQADVAEQVFSTLMGDVVEPRKEFIQNNALNATNIDA